MRISPTFASPEWLSDHLDSVTVVDVRSEQDYESLAHVPGAVNVPADRFRDPSSVSAGKLPAPDDFADLLESAGIDSADTLVAYDDESGVLAARFLLTAVVFGHTGQLALLDGGIDGWRNRFDCEASPHEIERSTYDATIPADSPLVDREAVERAVEAGDVVVDTRTAVEYESAHIPGAIHLDWEEFLTTDSAGVDWLKPKNSLEALLEKKGIDRDERVLLYCNTARRLSHTYVVLSHLGYEDVAFYEGSLTDWIRAAAPDWDPVSLTARVRSFSGTGGFDAMVDELGDDVLNRLKLVGLYHQKQHGYFMLRTRIPGGILTTSQARVIGDVADEFARAPADHGGTTQNPVFGDGYLDLTTRQDVQMHWIRIDDVDEIWRRYEAVGLSTMQACGNSIRNVVGCPAAGIDPNEVVDVRPIVDRVSDRFLGDRRYANLPRKFKISITGCHENCARAQIQDLAFTPAVRDGVDGFAVRVGGGLSDGPRVGSDLECFVTRDQVDDLVAAVADLYVNHGSYLDTAVNRLRYLVEEWGVETFREELERYAPFEFEPPDETLTTGYRGDHVGIHEQEDGRRYVGLPIPVGRLTGTAFTSLAALADRYGDGELRVTPNQNLVIPHIDERDTDAILADPVIQRYSPTSGPFTRGVVACTGQEFCTYGIIETKNRAVRWARALDEWADAVGIPADEAPIRVHLSGCSASCAQPQIADVGLRGEVYRTDEETGGAADVGLGGAIETDDFIDWIAGSVPIDDVPPAIQRTLLAYEADRLPGETFAEWTRRTSNETLRTYVSGGSETGAGRSSAPEAK